MDVLEAGAPAVEVMTEYVRACRLLGHSAPEPAGLHAAYTAEDGMDLQALDDDHRTLSAAVAGAEGALLLQEQARRALATAWRGAGAEAAADHLARHAEAAATALDGLRGTAAALTDLRNRLRQLIDAKVGTAQDIEARGMRAEWLSASRIVTTGTGDRAGASEMVDMQVAPFVANDIALDWVCAMRDTESAVRQAYRDAVAAIVAEASVVFERPGLSVTEPSVAESVSGPSSPAPVAPAGYVAGPVPAGAAPAQAPAVPMAPPLAAPPAPPPAALDPMAAAPMPTAASPLGPGMSGMSGLSGLGQSFADLLGSLFGSGGDGLGESLGAAGDLDSLTDDVPEDTEPDDLDGIEDEGDVDDEDAEEEEPLEDETSVAEPGEQPAEEEAPVENVVPVAVPPEPLAPTPVAEPPAEPVVAEPAEPVPSDTPCEIAADELPQAGP
ncbi:hypothetical protein ASE48_28625 [Mycobacterium sp. Root265]|nr:hypothetical protein ASE48_28625 [Mycobacterium sp. Root265]